MFGRGELCVMAGDKDVASTIRGCQRSVTLSSVQCYDPSPGIRRIEQARECRVAEAECKVGSNLRDSVSCQ